MNHDDRTNQEKQVPQEPGKIKDLVYYFLNLLSAKAWQYLGLIAHPETGQILVDLEEARKAIDLYSVILGEIKKDLSREENRELEAHLANLQLNFIEKMKEIAES
ncbi:DUF1844 domain-containing protein [Thermatribacter velox]|uniref:DUF1844 domain-containing protein n=1 Tax=Thermatribacter velox TaxID=3039681 RepID=A0ABZ2Y8H7_9BACT